MHVLQLVTVTQGTRQGPQMKHRVECWGQLSLQTCFLPSGVNDKVALMMIKPNGSSVLGTRERDPRGRGLPNGGMLLFGVPGETEAQELS